MMATNSAPRKLATYAKSPRDPPGSKPPLAKPSTPAVDELYDFPESDDGAPKKPVQRSKAATPAKPAIRQRTKPQKAAAAYDFPSDDELSASTPQKAPRGLTTKTQSKSYSQSQRAKPSVTKRSPTNKPQRPSPIAQRNNDVDRKRAFASAFDSKESQHSSERNAAIPSRPAAAPYPRTPSNQRKTTSYTTSRTSQANPPVADGNRSSNPTPGRFTRPAQVPPPTAKSPPLSKPPKSHNNSATQTPQPRKRVRLIDHLASQREDSSESESGSDDGHDASTSAESTRNTPQPASQAPSQTPMSQSSVRYGREGWSRPGTLINKKVKLTYSQTRSIRDESQSQQQATGGTMDLIQEALVSSPSPPPGDEFDMDEDEDDLPKTGIKSLHELRRAGANNRFGDEMQDLMSRIDKPGSANMSMRRNALLDLAQRLQRDDFAAQFRDHAGRDNVAKEIGKETEPLSAFGLAAALTTFLSSQQAPNLLKRLAEENVGKLLARLLRQEEDIDAIARRRDSNLSKMGRASVTKIKEHLIRMPIWHGCKVTDLTPRTVALRLLHILQQNLDLRNQADIVRHLENELADAAEAHARSDSVGNVNFALVALVMEAESGADTVALGQDQVARQANTSAHLLRKVLPRWPSDLGEVPSAILKLAINATNTDLGAKAFSDREILAGVATCVAEGLREVQEAVAKGSLAPGLYDGLLLNMGVLINILEHCPASRSTMDDESLGRLADLYLAIRPSVVDVSDTLRPCSQS